MNIFQVAYFQHEEFLNMIDNHKYSFTLDELAKTYLIKMPNINYGMIRNIFEKLYFIKNEKDSNRYITVSDIETINPYIDSSTFDQLITFISLNQFRNAVSLLSIYMKMGTM